MVNKQIIKKIKEKIKQTKKARRNILAIFS